MSIAISSKLDRQMTKVWFRANGLLKEILTIRHSAYCRVSWLRLLIKHVSHVIATTDNHTNGLHLQVATVMNVELCNFSKPRAHLSRKISIFAAQTSTALWLSFNTRKLFRMRLFASLSWIYNLSSCNSFRMFFVARETFEFSWEIAKR